MTFSARHAAAAIFLVHLALHAALGALGWLEPFELFSLMLLGANLAIAAMLWRGAGEVKSCLCAMLLIAGHGLVGQRLAPDSLTSGAMLTVNILAVHVGIKIYENMPAIHFASYVLSYLGLFWMFIVAMSNAESLFLLFLMGLAATGRDFKLLACFWAIVLSFTFCQPYAWECALASFLVLGAAFSAKGLRFNPAGAVFLVCGLALTLFVLLPALVVVCGEDPRNIVSTLKSQSVRDAIYTTALTATASTAALAVFCVPLAYALSRFEFRGKSLLLALADLPIVIPQSAAGIAILRLFGRNQYLGETVYNIFGARCDGTAIGICLAQTFVAMPFLLKGALAAFDGAPASLDDAARTLGASSFGAFWRVALPLASRGVGAALILAWARAAGEFGAVLFVAPSPETAPVAVYNTFNSVGLVQTAPLVTTILLFSMAMFFALQLLLRLTPRPAARGGL